MTMPDATAEDFSSPGLQVKVAGLRSDRHPFGEMTDIKLTLDILNQTEDTFSTFDIGLEDELGNLFFPSLLGDKSMGKIEPGSHCNTNMTFNVYNAKMRHRLVLFKPFSREPLAKLTLSDAMLASAKGKGKVVSAR
jgi:hypothetical protein